MFGILPLFKNILNENNNDFDTSHHHHYSHHCLYEGRMEAV